MLDYTQPLMADNQLMQSLLGQPDEEQKHHQGSQLSQAMTAAPPTQGQPYIPGFGPSMIATSRGGNTIGVPWQARYTENLIRGAPWNYNPNVPGQGFSTPSGAALESVMNQNAFETGAAN